MTSDVCHGSTISSADCLWELNHAQKAGQLYRLSDVGFSILYVFVVQRGLTLTIPHTRSECGNDSSSVVVRVRIPWLFLWLGLLYLQPLLWLGLLLVCCVLLWFREAAKECRRKKKEYVRCLENRVAVLENQNKTLIDELKTLKELYCQHDVHT